MTSEPIRIANCSGFFGDRPSGAREMVDGGPIDVLTGDWLAELTMLILSMVTDDLQDEAVCACCQVERVAGSQCVRCAHVAKGSRTVSRSPTRIGIARIVAAA